VGDKVNPPRGLAWFDRARFQLERALWALELEGVPHWVVQEVLRGLADPERYRATMERLGAIHLGAEQPEE
jgi:hypothetical protein